MISFDFLSMMPGLITTGGLGMLCYIYRKEVGRIDDLEIQATKFLSENQVRQILSDKLDPMKEDIQEIKQTTNKLLDIQLKKH